MSVAACPRTSLVDGAFKLIIYREATLGVQILPGIVVTLTLMSSTGQFNAEWLFCVEVAPTTIEKRTSSAPNVSSPGGVPTETIRDATRN